MSGYHVCMTELLEAPMAAAEACAPGGGTISYRSRNRIPPIPTQCRHQLVHRAEDGQPASDGIQVEGHRTSLAHPRGRPLRDARTPEGPYLRMLRLRPKS